MATKSADPKTAIKDVWPGQSVELLKELHVLTREGGLNADARRKLKQVLHLYQLIKPALDEIWGREAEPVLADMGAGKSYLGFILYDLFVGPQKRGRVVAVESRSDLVASSQALSRRFGFERMDFVDGTIADATLPATPHIVTALHACDTATDDAILFALKHEAKFIALVPCCQAEVARQLEELPKDGLGQLWRHPIQRREFGSHLTNVIRALVLEANGYRVRVTEFTGFEHTLKNEFIFAEKIQRGNAMARAQLDALLEKMPVRPKVLLSLSP